MYPIMFVDYVSSFSRAMAADGSSGSTTGLILEEDLSAGRQLPGSTSASMAVDVDEGDLTGLNRWLIGMAMTVPIVLLNIRGVDFVGDAAVSFCVLAVTPFVAMVLIGSPVRNHHL